MNERDVAKGFLSHWAEFFPMLSPNFINAFNEAYTQPILGPKGIVRPIPYAGGPHSADVIAEYAFALAAQAQEEKTAARTLAKNEEARKRALTSAVEKIRERRRPGGPEPDVLSQSEQKQAVNIAGVYKSFLLLWPANETVQFSPPIRGAGVLGACRADLSIGETLYEVKTVSRNFQSRDLRQLILYLALQAETGVKRWEYAGLLNPREAVYCRFSVDWLIARLSGGHPPRLVLGDFLRSLGRDMVLDKRF